MSDTVEPEEIPTFDELVDILRERLFDADAINPSAAHSFKELMSDHADVIADNWYQQAYEELDAMGHVTENHAGFGFDANARLTADGRYYVRQARGI